MFGTMDLQIQYLLLLQTFRIVTNGFFDNLFMTATWLGELIIPIGFMSILYWFFNKKAGTFLFFAFGLTLYVNVFLKMTACIKRPWLIDSRVMPLEQALPAADGYSFPSGHTAGAMAVWGGCAYFWKHKKEILFVGILLVLLVGFSRNYVGVHTPQDVIVSILAGIIVLISADKLLKWIDKKTNNDIVFYITMLIMIAILSTYLHLKCCAQMQTYNILTDNINPIEMKHTVYGKLGFMLGIFSGWIMEKRFVGYAIPKISLLKKVLLSTLGIGILLGITILTGKFFAIFFAKRIATSIAAFIIPFFVLYLYPALIQRYCKSDK